MEQTERLLVQYFHVRFLDWTPENARFMIILVLARMLMDLFVKVLSQLCRTSRDR